ncbi:MAG: serine hydrolase domain-containing protein [Vicinamibacterales bacterium]
MDAPPALRRVVEAAIARGVTPGGVVEAGDSGQAVWRYAAGRFTYAIDAPPVAPDTVYDLASLTKVLATTTLALRAHAAGRLALESPLAGVAGGGRPVPTTVADLLEHAAGFPAHRPYFQSVAGRTAYLERIAAEPVA